MRSDTIRGATAWREDSVPGPVRIAVGRTGEGPNPLVALHGITSHHHAFNSVARHLQYPDGLLAVDLRGRGDSAKPTATDGAYGAYGMEEHARDVMRVLDHFALERAVLAGHSMGGFVALHAALLFPARVTAIALLDSGWPRVAGEQDKEAAAAIETGLARSFSRLTRTFPTRDDYLNFWFPQGGVTLEGLPPDLADNYAYDIRPVDGGWQPKASLDAAMADARWTMERNATAQELRGVTCPVALVRPAAGFFPDTPPLITPEALRVMRDVLPFQSDTLIAGANHYTMMYEPYAIETARAIDEFVASVTRSKTRNLS